MFLITRRSSDYRIIGEFKSRSREEFSRLAWHRGINAGTYNCGIFPTNAGLQTADNFHLINNGVLSSYTSFRSSSWFTASDRRLKNRIESIDKNNANSANEGSRKQKRKHYIDICNSGIV
jgi:hypothetical protein